MSRFIFAVFMTIGLLGFAVTWARGSMRGMLGVGAILIIMAVCYNAGAF